MAEIVANLRSVCDKILYAATKRTSEHRYYEPRLVAVSKLQSTELILSAYEAGQRHFGENYVNELVEKALNPQILEKCKEIKWHFIDVLNNSWPRFRKSDDSKLNIMVQVNTSGEKEKSGCDIIQVSTLVKHIINNCHNLKFLGLMTIGMFGYNIANGPNPDFICLIKCREKISDELGIDIKNIELSMGMSNDYEHAIELGSTNVRVGTAIFGNRPQKNTL
ncbi:unnamed protein product [Lasius platythorax]|uniref:Alanine racemase N-terminal domain-containing protein n=1 Tax=Lasius platythorax TaxID=488582 RepID=A0AAV2NRT4_9HYME